MTPFWTQSIKQYSEALLVRFGIFYRRLFMSRIKLSSDFDVLHEETLRLCKKLHFYNANTGEGSLVIQPSWIKEGQDKWRREMPEVNNCLSQCSTAAMRHSGHGNLLTGLDSCLRVSPLSSGQCVLHWELCPHCRQSLWANQHSVTHFL